MLFQKLKLSDILTDDKNNLKHFFVKCLTLISGKENLFEKILKQSDSDQTIEIVFSINGYDVLFKKLADDYYNQIEWRSQQLAKELLKRKFSRLSVKFSDLQNDLERSFKDKFPEFFDDE